MGLLSADLIALFVAMHLLSLGDRQTTGSSGDYERTEQQDGTNGYHETISGVGSRKTCLPSEDAAYTTLKLALSACEQYGQLSTNLLAAQVLVVAYETGTSRYPAAYISVGTCTRICHIMGLHNKRLATQLPPKPDTWMETEERRRLWWACLIYDRTVTICFRFRPLSIPSIGPDEILPGSDADWDDGEICVNSLLVMSIESQARVSPFARTCQAAHLLGRVCQHVDEHAEPADADFHYQEAHSIRGVGEALLTMIRQESADARYNLLTAMALCCNALLTLYDTHCCIEVAPIEIKGRNKGMRLELQQLWIDGYKRMSAVISDFGNDIRKAMADQHVISPLVLHCLYEAGCHYAWIVRENGSEAHLASLQDIREVLEAIKPRWAVAEEYLELLKDTEYHYNGGCSG